MSHTEGQGHCLPPLLSYLVPLLTERSGPDTEFLWGSSFCMFFCFFYYYFIFFSVFNVFVGCLPNKRASLTLWKEGDRVLFHFSK